MVKHSLFTSLMKNITRALIYIPLLALVLMALLIGTPFGSRMSVMLANALVPNLEISYQSGSLNRDLKLASVGWFMDGVKVNISRLHLAWQPACLLNKQLCLNQLDADKVSVKVDTSAFGSSPETVQETGDFTLSLPFAISLDQATLANIKISVDKMQFNSSKLTLSADWPRDSLRIHQLQTQRLLVHIPLSDDKVKPASKPQNIPWPLANLPRVHNPVPVIVESAKLQNSSLILGKRKDQFAQIKLKGQYLGTQVELKHFKAQHTMGSIEITGITNLSSHYSMDLDINADLKPNKLLEGLGKQKIKLKAKGNLAHLSLNTKGTGDTDFRLTAKLDLANPKIPYHINFSAKTLRWPLTESVYQAKGILLDSTGSLYHQKATVSGELSTPFYPDLKLAAELVHKNAIKTYTKASFGSKNQGNLSLKHLSLLSDETVLHLSGDLGYRLAQGKQPLYLDWSADLQAQQLNPSDLHLPNKSSLPKGRIDTAFHTQGHFSAQDWLVELSQLAIEGQLAGYPLDLRGDLSIDNKLHIKANSLTAKALGAELNAQGSAGEKWDLNGKLTVPDISPWLKDASGKFSASIKVTGQENTPKLNLNGRLDKIALDEFTLNKVDINGWLNLTNTNDFKLAIIGKNIRYQQTKLDQLKLNAKGDLAKQQLQLLSQGDIRLNSRINTEYNRASQQIAANLNKLNIESILGKWVLNKPAILHWNLADHIGQLSQFCLQNKKNHLCLDKNVNLAEQGTANISFHGNPGEIIAPLLPEKLSWYSPASLTVSLNWKKNQKPIADLLVNFDSGSVTLNRSEQLPATLTYQGAQIHGHLDANKLTLRTYIDASQLAKLKSQLSINVGTDRTLDGQVSIDHINLSALQPFMPQIATLKGKLTSDLKLSGTLSDPQLKGNIKLNHGAFAAMVNPTLVNNINLTLGFNGQKSHIDGQFNMGKGNSQINGILDWSTGDPRGNIKITGQQLAVIFPPLAIVKVSPDLNIRFSPKGTKITGNVNIPEGEIKIVQMAAGGVPVSPDLVFKDSISASISKRKPYPISMTLNIQVNDKVSISGMGLRGNLSGTLTLQQQALRPPMLFGEIQVTNGQYKFFGQQLQISTGELQFVGPPAMPNLNIEAVRKVKDDNNEIVAGIRITGTPKKPSVTLFSNPSMEQAEILSYIIKGSGFNNNKEQNDALMMSAALSLSTQLANSAIGYLGSTATNLMEKIGISNLQLDANDDGQVAISGYIGDRLMVKYGIGVFNPGYELTVRYYLMTRLYLETVSGSLEQSLDIYYSFDL